MLNGSALPLPQGCFGSSVGVKIGFVGFSEGFDKGRIEEEGGFVFAGLIR